MEIELECTFVLEYIPPPGEPGWDGPLVIHNTPTIEGLNQLLSMAFRGTPLGQPYWQIGLIDNAGYTGISPNDTNALHPGWSEWTNIVGSRPTFDAVDPVGRGGSTVSSIQTIYFTASGSLRGALLTSTSTFGQPGFLYCTSVANAGYPISAGSAIQIQYGISFKGKT